MSATIHIRPTGRPGTAALLLSLVSLTAAACAAATDPPDETSSASCDQAIPAAASAIPLAELEVTGIDTSIEGLYAEVRVPDMEAAGLAAVEPLDGDRVALVVPIHPTASADGGEVSIRITNDEVGCPEFALTIEPLPAATTTFAASVTRVLEAIERAAHRHGTSTEAFVQSEPGGYPSELLPLALTYIALAHPDDPESLKALADGTATTIDGTPVDFDFLDRLVTHIGLAAALDDLVTFIDSMEPLPPARASSATLAMVGPAPPPSPTNLADAVPQCASSFRLFEIESAAKLSNLMQRQAEAERLQTGATGQVFSDVGLVVVGATSLYPPAWGAGSAISFFTTAISESNNAYVYLLPSRLSLYLELAPASFPEDAEDPGKWTATAMARSRPWNVTDTLARAAIDAIPGAKPGRLGLAAKLSNVPVARDVAKEVSDATLAAAGASANDEGVLTIPEQCWDGIDVSSPLWTEARVRFPELAAVRLEPLDHQLYWPERTGTGEIEVNTKSGAFGNTTGLARATAEVREIEVHIDPPFASVTPGETITLTARVRNATDTRLRWTRDGIIVGRTSGDVTHEFIFETPADSDPSPYPIVLKAISESTKGIRGRPNPPERSAEARLDAAAFRLSLDTDQVTLMAGGADHAVTVTIITVAAELDGEVALSLDGLPRHSAGIFTVNPAMTRSLLALVAFEDAQPGTYLVTVTGTSGEHRDRADLSVTILPPETEPFEGSLSGLWVGTGCNTPRSCNYDVRFRLQEIGGALRADVDWQSGGVHGPVDTGGRGVREGDSITIVFESGQGLRKVYEGAIVNGIFRGTVTTFLGDLEGPAGPGTFEVTKQE